VKYFNGFSLLGEEILFEEFADKSDFTYTGFSYGAQKAFESALQSQERIERLILLSPAFFQCEKSSFIRTQLHYFSKDRDAYLAQFIQNAASPSKCDLSYLIRPGELSDLEALLSYEWEREKVETLLERGTRIEVYLGGRDKLMQSEKAFDFFSSLTTAYLIKEAGHFLLSCERRQNPSIDCHGSFKASQ